MRSSFCCLSTLNPKLSTSSVSHANPNCFRGLDELAIRLDEAELVDGLLDGHGIYVVGLVTDHAAEGTLFREFRSHDAETNAQNAVERGRRAPTLEVAQGAGAAVFSGHFFELGADLLADAAEADFTAFVRGDRRELAVGQVRAFRHDDQRAVVALRVSLLDELGDLLGIERDFRQETFQ